MVTREQIKTTLESMEKTDLSSGKMYVDALAHYKDCVDFKSMNKALKAMVEDVAEELKLPKTFVNRVVSIFNLAQKTVEYKLHTMDGKSNNVKLYFYNIEKAINLLAYVTENYTEDKVTNVKNKLNKVKKVDDKRVYNNDYADVLKDLYKEYKIALSEDGIVKIEITESGLDDLVARLTPELKEYLLNKLS